jgi:hypothetical protein
MLPGWPRVIDQTLDIPDAPGLGMAPDLESLADYQTFSGTVSA